METQFSRTELLLGTAAIQKLQNSHIIVFGVGGVGGYVVEVLARSGVGQIDIVDDDYVTISNINRQIIATHSTIGKAKVDVCKARIYDINPHCIVKTFKTFYLPEKSTQFDFAKYDYVVDCIDTVTAKIDIITRCYNLDTPIISSMGAAFKLDATQLQVTNLFKTKNDPIAKILRKKLHKTNVHKLKVVYSSELPHKSIENTNISSIDADKTLDELSGTTHKKRYIPASNAWVPAATGLIIGSEVIKDIIYKE